MKLHLASGNAHKVAEFQALAEASGLAVTMVSAKAVGGMPDVAEDTGTFHGNAGKKARALREKLGDNAWVLADDSGLCVDALHGAPGVESAYFAGPQHDSAANLRKLVEVLRDVPADRRGAHFICVLFLIIGDGTEYVFDGRSHGHLLLLPRGGAGFGYDPLFVPVGEERTFAEMSEREKNAVSHRARAWEGLAAFLRQAPVVRGARIQN